jgi:hypothetical protein
VTTAADLTPMETRPNAAWPSSTMQRVTLTLRWPNEAMTRFSSPASLNVRIRFLSMREERNGAKY